MIEARGKVINCCEILAEKTKDADITGDTVGTITAIANNAREQQLVVPVVGAFSAGKSTLINNLLGNEILPTDVRPETSLATELRYSNENYIVAVKDNGDTDRYNVDEIKTVAAKAKDYRFAQLFLNNNKLQEIEPLVLVDMPGFDSPLDLHNKAIMAYLDRGCYYIVLSSVEEGNITKSLERRLDEINGLNRDFSFFLSKANLRPEDSINSLVAYYQNQLMDKYGNGKKVVPFGKTPDEVIKCLKSIDVNAVFLKLYRDILVSVCNDVINNINLQVSSSKKDAEKLRIAINEMGNSKEKLKKKMNSDLDDMRRRYSGTFINEIIADVSNALDDSLDELVSIAISGDQDRLSQHLNEIARSALTSSIYQKLDVMNQQIAIDLSESFNDLDKVMKDIDLDGNYIKNITDKVGSALKAVDGLLAIADAAGKNGPVVNIASSAAVKVGAKAIGGAIALTPIPIIGQVIGLIVMFLPEIIGGIFGNSQKEKQKEAMRSKLSGEVFPSIKRKIRDEIPAVIQNHVTAMITNVKEQFELQIKNQEEAINTQIAQESTKASDREAAQQKLGTILSDIQNLTNQIMTWGK